MPQIFPYGITLHEDGKIALFPAAEVSFSAKDGESISLFLILDSGATISALPKSDAPMLGINAEQGIPMAIAGIGDGLLRGWRHEITVRIGQETCGLPVVFLDSGRAPRVLGREGIFDRFMIIFEEDKRRSMFARNDEDVVLRISNLYREET